MIVVPVSCYYQLNSLCRIDADTFEILQGTWFPYVVDTRIDDHPTAETYMQDDALAVTGTEQHDLKFILIWRVSRFPGFYH